MSSLGLWLYSLRKFVSIFNASQYTFLPLPRFLMRMIDLAGRSGQATHTHPWFRSSLKAANTRKRLFPTLVGLTRNGRNCIIHQTLRNVAA